MRTLSAAFCCSRVIPTEGAICLLLLTLAHQPPARADFVVTAAPADGQVPTVAMPTQPAPADLGKARTAAPSAPGGLVRRRFSKAIGFGDHVPLRFAVRQIVPRAVRVTYGPGTRPDALVSWRGGAGWNKVLGAAVEPVGLRLVMTYMAVEIRK